MEDRKNQFLGFIIILLIIGFLNYFRRLVNGKKFTRAGKILYLATMITFVVGIMFVLYFTDLNNIISFCIGLLVTTLSEHIANLFVAIGNNFIPIAVKFIKRFTGVDLSEDLMSLEELDRKHKEDSERRKNGERAVERPSGTIDFAMTEEVPHVSESQINEDESA